MVSHCCLTQLLATRKAIESGREFLPKRITSHVRREANDQPYDCLKDVLAIVARGRYVRLIGENRRQNDCLDAQTLARLAPVSF